MVLQGWARMGVGRDEVLLEAGDFLFFPPGQDHALLEAAGDLDLFVFALHPALADRAFETRVLRSSQGRRLPESERERWADVLVGLTDVSDELAVEGELVTLFSGADTLLHGGHVTSRRALSAVLDTPGLSSAELAKKVGTGRSEMSRRVHSDWGVPLVELRARSKLMRFVAAIESGVELTRAALDADFGSYAQCHRVFQRSLGCSPSEYLREGQRRGAANPRHVSA